jgi:hypothetical protein
MRFLSSGGLEGRLGRRLPGRIGSIDLVQPALQLLRTLQRKSRPRLKLPLAEQGGQRLGIAA